MSTLNRALMKPIPTLAVALKWVSSTTSIFSTPGPHWPTWSGSMTNAQTFSRRRVDRDGAFEVHAVLRGDREVASAGRGRQSGKDTEAGRKAVGSLMNRVRQPIEQNA